LRFDPGANALDESELRSEKACSQRIVTDGGMQNDFSELHSEKIFYSSVWRLDPGSKVNEHKLEQWLKHLSPIERTRFGIQMEGSDEQYEKTDLSIVTSRDLDSNVTTDSDEQK
jgi:hypothetical protein